ncbi:MAG: DUF3782 domain-containing protein, partial [Magnetococcales bacterium]|nr:DUF3782 domain-containing protein [Magnetococcales bacterium]
MPLALTVDDVWKMFQETNRLFQESQQKWEQRSQEADRKMQELTASQKELTASQKETDRQMRESSEVTDKKIKEVSTLVGNLGGRWGEFVEGLVAPACETIFAQWGIPVHKVSRRVRAKLLDGRNMEVDVLVENTDTVALVEVKSELTIESVRE